MSQLQPGKGEYLEIFFQIMNPIVFFLVVPLLFDLLYQRWYQEGKVG